MRVCVALRIQHAMRMRHIVIRGPFLLYNIFPYYLINGTIFGGEGGEITEHKMCFEFLYNFYPRHSSFYELLNEI